MSVLFVLIPAALLLVVLFVAAYAWSTRTGQFDDLTTPAMRMLHDESSVAGRSQRVEDDGDVDRLLQQRAEGGRDVPQGGGDHRGA